MCSLSRNRVKSHSSQFDCMESTKNVRNCKAKAQLLLPCLMFDFPHEGGKWDPRKIFLDLPGFEANSPAFRSRKDTRTHFSLLKLERKVRVRIMATKKSYLMRIDMYLAITLSILILLSPPHSSFVLLLLPLPTL